MRSYLCLPFAHFCCHLSIPFITVSSPKKEHFEGHSFLWTGTLKTMRLYTTKTINNAWIYFHVSLATFFFLFPVMPSHCLRSIKNSFVKGRRVKRERGCALVTTFTCCKEIKSHFHCEGLTNMEIFYNSNGGIIFNSFGLLCFGKLVYSSNREISYKSIILSFWWVTSCILLQTQYMWFLMYVIAQMWVNLCVYHILKISLQSGRQKCCKKMILDKNKQKKLPGLQCMCCIVIGI